MRTYNLKNFKGEFFATTSDITKAVGNLKQPGKEVLLDTLLGTKGNENEIAVYNADGVFKSSTYTVGVTTKDGFGGANKLATEVGSKEYTDNQISLINTELSEKADLTDGTVPVDQIPVLPGFDKIEDYDLHISSLAQVIQRRITVGEEFTGSMTAGTYEPNITEGNIYTLSVHTAEGNDSILRLKEYMRSKGVSEEMLKTIPEKTVWINDSGINVSVITDLQNSMPNKLDKVTGVTNNIVVFGDGNAIKDSTYKVATDTTLSGANDIPTASTIKSYVDKAVNVVVSAAINVSGVDGNAVTVSDSGTERTIQLVLDGTTLSQSESGLKSNLTIVKLADATSGYAASYQLQDGSGNPIGSTIDILKDQFLKSALLVWGTSANLNEGVPANESATKTETAKYPFLKLVLYTNENGTPADDTLTTTLYIPVDELFHDYTVEQGASKIQLAISNSNELSATVVAGSIGTTELSSGVVASLGLADSAIQEGDVDRIIYTPAEGTPGEGGYKEAVSVKGALDDLYNQIEAGDSIASQITDAINALDYSDSAVENQYVSSVTETDGVISVTRVALPVVSVTYDGGTKELKVNGTAITTLNSETIGADPAGSADNVKSVFLGKAVELVDVTVTLDGNNVVDENGCKSILADGVVTAVVPGKVICVYDADGNQIYPDVTYNKVSKESTLVADFGSTAVDVTWDITYSRIITE